MSRSLWMLMVAFAILFPSAAAAQSTPPAPSQPPAVETAPAPPRVEETVSVTATRGTVDLDKSPASVSVVTRDTIEQRGPLTVDQALTTVEGVTAWRQRGITDTEAGVGMRGFTGRGTGQTRVLVLIDGQPLNNSYTGAVNWNGLPIEEVDRVEVVRGPFSSLYGGNAMGGVVNVITRPVDRRSFDLNGQYGTYGTLNASGRFSARVKRAGFSVGYTSVTSDGYATQEALRTATDSTATGGVQVTGIDRYLTRVGAVNYAVGLRGNNQLDRYAVRARGEYTIGARTFASFQFVRQASTVDWGPYHSSVRDAAGTTVDTGAVVFLDGATWKRTTLLPSNYLGVSSHAASYLYQGQLLHSMPASGELRLQGGVVDAPGHGNWTGTPATTATVQGGPGSRSEQMGRGTFASAVWSKRVATPHLLSIGADLRRDRSSTTAMSTTNYLGDGVLGGRDTYASASAVTMAAFVQDEFTVSDRLQLTAGGRLDYWRTEGGEAQRISGGPLFTFGERSAGSATGKVAGVISVVDGTTVRASLGTAFRSPSVFELYRDTQLSSGSLLLGNADLEPERLVSWETGLRHRVGRGIETDVAYYENRIRNLIFRSTDLQFDPTGLTSRFLNAGRARARGFEGGVTVRPAAWLTLHPTYTFSDSIITDNPQAPANVGKQVPFLPRHVAAGTATVNAGRWGGTLTGRYQTAVWATDTNTDTVKGVPGSYDAFFETDLLVSVRAHRLLTVVASVENMFDRQYYLFYRAPGRVFMLGARLRN